MKKEFVAGLVLGAVIFGATPAIASGIIAELSTQPIYVDGEQVEMTAYSIEGNNYVRLRDIGEAVGFDVSWNSAEQRVDIDSDSPYTADDAATEDSTPQTVAEMVSETYLSSNETKTAYQVTVTNQTIAGKLSNGQDPTEENIQAMLDEIAIIYPQYTSWGATYNNGDLHWYEGHTGCNSYTYMVRDILYGTDCEAIETFSNLALAQIGDIVYLKNATTNAGHWMVVSDVAEDSQGMYIESMSGNTNAMTYYDVQFSLAVLREQYPDSVIYRYY